MKNEREMFVLSRVIFAQCTPYRRHDYGRSLKQLIVNFFLMQKCCLIKCFRWDFVMWHATNFKYISNIVGVRSCLKQRLLLQQNYARTSIKLRMERFWWEWLMCERKKKSGTEWNEKELLFQMPCDRQLWNNLCNEMHWFFDAKNKMVNLH